MKVDVVNAENKKVGAVESNARRCWRDGEFAGRVNSHLIWEAVVHANAADRRGTHATKNRANVSGSGRKPWKQKGTGRARIGSIRNPLWRHGGTVFGPQPRSYGYALPRKVKRGGVVAALAQKIQDGVAHRGRRAVGGRRQNQGGHGAAEDGSAPTARRCSST